MSLRLFFERSCVSNAWVSTQSAVDSMHRIQQRCGAICDLTILDLISDSLLPMQPIGPCGLRWTREAVITSRTEITVLKMKLIRHALTLNSNPNPNFGVWRVYRLPDRRTLSDNDPQETASVHYTGIPTSESRVGLLLSSGLLLDYSIEQLIEYMPWYYIERSRPPTSGLLSYQATTFAVSRVRVPM